MSRLYLITGFLGAGKTTFLRRFVHLFEGQKVRLIVNEFGREGMDGQLLKDLRAVMQEISGGSIFCSCRLDQFEAALEQCGADETILVEASGLSDPTGVRRLFLQTGRFPQIHYEGSICLVDAVRFPKLYETARTCVRQLAASDVAVINKADKASREQMEKTRAIIVGQRPDMPVVETVYGAFPEGFLDLIQERGARQTDMPLIADLSLRRMTVRLSECIGSYDLEMFIRMFAENTFRVKGFVATCDQGMVLVDCVGNTVSISPTAIEPPEEKTGILTILSGAKMPVYKAVREACRWYETFVLSVENG